MKNKRTVSRSASQTNEHHFITHEEPETGLAIMGFSASYSNRQGG
jgi:hypothetical protein